MARKQNGDSRAGFSLEIERGEEEPSYSGAHVSNRIRPGSRATSSRASSTTSVRYRSGNYHHNPTSTGGSIQILQDGFDDDQVGLHVKTRSVSKELIGREALSLQKLSFQNAPVYNLSFISSHFQCQTNETKPPPFYLCRYVVISIFKIYGS